MSCGSGRVLADMLSGKKPEVDVSALTVDRFKYRFRLRLYRSSLRGVDLRSDRASAT